MSDRFQVSVGRTTYTIEDRESGAPAYVKLSRSRPPIDNQRVEHAEFFVPTSLIVEYVLARLAPRVLRMLVDLQEEP